MLRSVLPSGSSISTAPPESLSRSLSLESISKPKLLLKQELLKPSSIREPCNNKTLSTTKACLVEGPP